MTGIFDKSRVPRSLWPKVLPELEQCLIFVVTRLYEARSLFYSQTSSLVKINHDWYAIVDKSSLDGQFLVDFRLRYYSTTESLDFIWNSVYNSVKGHPQNDKILLDDILVPLMNFMLAKLD